MRKTTKCATLYAINDLRVEERTLAKCQDDEDVLQVKSCGVCGSDIGRVYSKGTYHFPTVIGHEFSGKVIFDPRGELTNKKAVVFPLIPCFSCSSCKNGSYATCENYDYYGPRRDGGMTEYITVKRWNILTMPDNLTFDEGAMCEPVSVARHAIKKLDIQQGDNLFISGAGPIGLIAGKWAKSFGAKDIFYIDVDERKLDMAKKLGFLKYEKGVLVDCALEGTGFGEPLETCLEAVKPQGRVVLMGNPSGEVNGRN